ncbi:MAG TPA: MerR family transcriptional regulator [Pseudobdellovibrionaceae bacterium]
MRDWITIGQLAKKTGLTARALRFYEAKGLLKSHYRGDNDYRFYSKEEVDHALQIKEFRDLGFSLSEIAELLGQDPQLTTTNLSISLIRKVESLQGDQFLLKERIRKLEALIASLTTVHKLSEPQRRIVMEELVTQAAEKIKARGFKISEDQEGLLRSEVQESQTRHFTKMMSLLDIIQSIAAEKGFKIGPGRGTAAASLLLYSKGFNHNQPEKFDLLPELFYHSLKPSLWIDVEYSAGQDFLAQLLQKTTLEELREAQIFFFQCPFLTVLSQVEKSVGGINFDAISDDDELVLQSFWNDRVEDIFLFDAPEKSVMHANSDLNFWQKENELKRYIWKLLKTYKVKGAEDILALCTLSFPVGNKKEMLEQYVTHEEIVPQAKNLPSEVLKLLQKTKGLLIYREDFIRIVRHYTNWSVAECNAFYSFKIGRIEEFAKVSEYNDAIPSGVRELLDREAKSVFLKSHMVCMWWFIKRSAILNSLYPDEYQAALKNWRRTYHSAWSDLGFIDKDYRPLALYF